MMNDLMQAVGLPQSLAAMARLTGSEPVLRSSFRVDAAAQASIASSGLAAAALVRSSFAAGHATLIRAPEATRAAVDVFQPQAAALAALSGRVKDAFDPRHILNPGRMYRGI